MVKKRCGYLQGYCCHPGECEVALGQPDRMKLVPADIQRVSRCCWHVSEKEQVKIDTRRQRRRRDWKVGNPYEGRLV